MFASGYFGDIFLTCPTAEPKKTTKPPNLLQAAEIARNLCWATRKKSKSRFCIRLFALEAAARSCCSWCWKSSKKVWASLNATPFRPNQMRVPRSSVAHVRHQLFCDHVEVKSCSTPTTPTTTSAVSRDRTLGDQGLCGSSAVSAWNTKGVSTPKSFIVHGVSVSFLFEKGPRFRGGGVWRVGGVTRNVFSTAGYKKGVHGMVTFGKFCLFCVRFGL